MLCLSHASQLWHLMPYSTIPMWSSSMGIIAMLSYYCTFAEEDGCLVPFSHLHHGWGTGPSFRPLRHATGMPMCIGVCVCLCVCVFLQHVQQDQLEIDCFPMVPIA
jgi:hypothetical protein